MEPKITTLIFDYDGVFLLDEYRGIRTVCLDEAAVENMEKKYYDASDCEDLWQELRDHFSLSFTDNDLSRAYNLEDEFQRQHKRRMFHAARELSKKFSLVLLSNQIQARGAYLRTHEDFRSFSHVFFSHEIGLRKPDENIFQYALDRISKTPSECLFIDDTAENIESASALGLQTYWYQNENEAFKKLEDLLKKF